MIDQQTSRLAGRVFMSWAASRAEAAAYEGFRRDMRRSMDAFGHRWRRRTADAAISAGFALGTALAVAAAGQRWGRRPRR